VKQNEVGFVKFRQQYGSLDYNKDDKDEPPPEVKVTELVPTRY